MGDSVPFKYTCTMSNDHIKVTDISIALGICHFFAFGIFKIISIFYRTIVPKYLNNFQNVHRCHSVNPTAHQGYILNNITFSTSCSEPSPGKISRLCLKIKNKVLWM